VVVLEGAKNGFDVGAQPLLLIAVRIRLELVGDAVKPVRDHERFKPLRLWLEPEPATVRSRLLVAPALCPGQHLLDKRSAQWLVRSPALLTDAEMDEIDEGKPIRACRGPIHDADKPPPVGEQISAPEIAVSEAAGKIGEGALQPLRNAP